MFGYVAACGAELSKDQRKRYGAVYCGICRHMRQEGANMARLALSYDMAFLALLLMSLYEPEETTGNRACKLHPLRPRPWIENEYVAYAADMNVALAYYKALDDHADEGKKGAKRMAEALKESYGKIQQRYPRQCGAIEDCISRLGRMEKENCSNPDAVAGCFGALMGQLLVYRQDLWQEKLQQMGLALGRYIYLADAAVDYRRDKKKNRYNPYLAMGMEENWAAWEQHLVLEMSRCTDYYERLPLVQDKGILDNILYSGVWMEYRRRAKNREDKHDR